MVVYEPLLFQQYIYFYIDFMLSILLISTKHLYNLTCTLFYMVHKPFIKIDQSSYILSVPLKKSIYLVKYLYITFITQIVI